MIIFSYAREETRGSLMGLDLFWGYSELFKMGFPLREKGLNQTKNAAGETPCCFQLL